MCRESDGIYIYNPIAEKFSMILKTEENQRVDNISMEDNVIFDT